MSLLAILIVGGGAGLAYPLVGLAAQWLALAVIASAAWRGAWPDTAAWQRFTWLFAGAAVLMTVQLIPLPPSWWRALPGRESAALIDGLLGGGTWRPISLTPDATLSALLALVVPFAAMCATASLTPARRLTLLRLIVVGAVVATALAALQVAAGGDGPVLYDTAHRAFGVGFFVNRNHQATFLLVAIVLAAVPGVGGRTVPGRVAVLGAALSLAIGVVATSSRTGLLLLPLASMVALALSAGIRRARRPLAIGAGLYLLAGLLLSRTDVSQRVLARFATVADELRYQYWDNTLYAVRQSLPFGTGFGSFGPVYRSIEPLEQVSPLVVNHAHADLLELVLEGGVPAILLAVAALVVLATALRNGWRVREDRGVLVAAGTGIGLILLGSLVDYPVRMTGIAGLCGGLLGLIAGIGAASAERNAPTERRGRWGVIGAALLVALLAGGDAIATFLTRHGQPAAAVTVAPWSSASWSALADAEQLAARPAAARAAAARALAIVPIDAAAVRAYGQADILLGNPGRGVAFMEAGAALGWRDTLTQLWLIGRARDAGDMTVAAERIDALVRRRRLGEQMVDQLRAVYRTDGGPQAIVARLADRPHWRQGFLNAVADDAPTSVPRMLDFLTRLRTAGVPATPAETLLIRWRLAAGGDIVAARRVWRVSGGTGEVADGDLEALALPLPGAIPPYGWGAPPLAGVHVVTTDRGANGSGRAARIASDGLSTGIALAQQLAVPPGRYRLTAMVRGAGAPGTIRIDCATTPDRASPLIEVPLDAGDDSGWRAVGGIVVVDGDCPAQRLGIGVRDRGGQAGAFEVDRIAITPVGIRR